MYIQARIPNSSYMYVHVDMWYTVHCMWPCMIYCVIYSDLFIGTGMCVHIYGHTLYSVQWTASCGSSAVWASDTGCAWSIVLSIVADVCVLYIHVYTYSVYAYVQCVLYIQAI